MGTMKMAVELTNHCNFKCVYCPHSVYGEPSENTGSGNVFDRPKGFMTPELFQKGVQEACRHAEDLTIGFFGEQQMHPHFDEMIIDARARKVAAMRRRGAGGAFKFILNSNWSLVTEKTLPALRSFNLVRISIDASKAETWEELCPGSNLLDKDGRPGKDRYQTLIDKTKWWLALPDRPRTWIIYVQQEANKSTEEFVEEWQPLLRPSDRIMTKTIITYGGVVFDPYMTENRCKVISEKRFIVAWDGRCTPCNLDVNLAMTAGNLNTHGVQQIVSGPRWAKALQGIRKKIGICSNCFDANNHGRRAYKGTKLLPILN